MRLQLLLILLLLPLLLNAKIWEKKGSNGIYVKIEAPKTDISILDTLTLNLTLKYPKNTEIDLNKIQANLLNRFSFGEQPFILKSVEKKEEPGSLQATFILEPQRRGTYQLTFLNIPFKLEDKTTEIISDIITVNVSIPPNDISFKADVAPLLPLSQKIPIEISYENKKEFLENKDLEGKQAVQNQKLFEAKKFPWIEILGLLVIFFIFLFIRTQRPKQRIEEKKQKKDAQKKALQALEGLNRDDFNIFYSQLTQVVRQYIEESYGINAPTLTTQEFFDELTKRPIFRKKTQKLLMTFLEKADRVKFGHYKPTQEECEEAFEAAFGFVQKYTT